jgi:ring-1,2-phenylacetyl-CoA epoxidase subunit PaaD
VVSTAIVQRSEPSAEASVEQVWDWLQAVPDPEIPVISIVDLGIVRNVAWQEGDAGIECVVTITPTYSGCPAMAVIAQAIDEALRSHGVLRPRLLVQVAPAWSTDWLSESGKAKLKDYGIAPPAQQAIDISGISRTARQLPQVVCPRCGSSHTRCTSQFGSTPCKSLYKCDDCLEPFDYFKCH